MSSSPEQSSLATPQTTPLNISRGISDTSMVSMASLGSGGESPPRHTYHGHTLSPPQMANVLGTPSSTPNSPHLGSRPSSGKLGLGSGMRRKFLRKAPPPPQVTISAHPPATPVQEDPLLAPDNQANKALFMRMLKSWQIQPKKIRSFRRTKRRPDKQYHSDDGYTSDPGILREDEDDETDNDRDEIRRLSNIQELKRKAEKIRRSIVEEDDTSLHENDEFVETLTDKPHKLSFKLNRSNFKSKSYYDQQRQKLEKVEAQLKELRQGGSLSDSRRTSNSSRIRGRIEGGLRGMSLGLKGRLTHAGSKFRRKRMSDTVPEDQDEEDEEDEDEDGQGAEEVIIEDPATEQEALVSILKVDLETLRLASEDALEQNKKWREDFLEQNDRLGESLALVIEKLEQERERADRLEGQLNDITELHQHAVDNIRAQLTQIENTTSNKCQDLEDVVDDFQSKFDHLDAHVHKLMDSSDVQQVHMVRKPMAGLLSMLLVLIAFVLNVVSVIRNKPALKFSVLAGLLAILLYFIINCTIKYYS